MNVTKRMTALSRYDFLAPTLDFSSTDSAPVQHLPLDKDHGTKPREPQQISRMPCDRMGLGLLVSFFIPEAQLDSCILTRFSQLVRILAEPVGPVYIPRNTIADFLKFGQTIRSEKHQLLDRTLNL